MTDPDRQGDAQAIIDAVSALTEGRTLINSDLVGIHVVDMPEGRKVEDLTPFLDRYALQPRRRAGCSRHESLASLVDHARRFRDPDSAAFVSTHEGRVLVVYDYDRSGGPDDEGQRRRAHRAQWTPKPHESWTRWTARDGKALDPIEFAEILEDGALDLLPPPETGPDASEADRRLCDLAARMHVTFGDPETIIALARGFKVNVDRKVESAVTLQSGEISMVYSETHSEDGRTSKERSALKVPGLFLIRVQRFDGDPAGYRVAVKLRYRPKAGGVAWTYSLHDIEAVERAAWAGLAQQLKDGVEADSPDGAPGEPPPPFPVFNGEPEGAV